MRTFVQPWILVGLLACAPLAGLETGGQRAADSAALAASLDAQSDEHKARHAARHPQQTLEFFGIAPGMTVVEVLPDAGWYSKLLLGYLGVEGRVVGADYPIGVFEKLGFLSDEALEARRSWVASWTGDAESWRGPGAARVSAFVLGSMPADLEGSADAVLFIRALHNLNRVEADGGFLSVALADARRALRPGGILGVVQHEARGDMPDAWADGSNGYLKREALIAGLERAGFEYLGATEVNANPLDRPGENEFVWRLPPSLATSRDDPALRARYEAIGESNRMTLKFRKPE